MKILAIATNCDEIGVLAKDLRNYSVNLRKTRSARSALDALPGAEAVLVGFGQIDSAINRVDFCQTVRASSDIPIIALVDNPKIGRSIVNLRAGVDDYLCKPYRAAALVTRLDEIYRRRGRKPDPPDGLLLLDDVAIDFRNRIVTVAGHALRLTNRQYQILALLAEHSGGVCPKDALVSRIWGKSWHRADRSLYVHINTLRAKLGRPNLIETVRGTGYRLVGQRAIAS